jgi:flagellar biosynthesis anti-sigma factor FlgM
MRVNQQIPSEQAASVYGGRTNESERIQADTSESSGGSGTAAGDRVDLSSLAGRISQAMASLSTRSAQRVTQLQKDFRAGRYQPDARAISQAMLPSAAPQV